MKEENLEAKVQYSKPVQLIRYWCADDALHRIIEFNNRVGSQHRFGYSYINVANGALNCISFWARYGITIIEGGYFGKVINSHINGNFNPDRLNEILISFAYLEALKLGVALFSSMVNKLFDRLIPYQ